MITNTSHLTRFLFVKQITPRKAGGFFIDTLALQVLLFFILLYY